MYFDVQGFITYSSGLPLHLQPFLGTHYVEFYDYSGNYITVNGVPIFDKVYAVYKNMGKYSDYPKFSTPTATTNFWPSMSFYGGRVNYNANTNLSGLLPLDCTAEFVGGGMGPFPSAPVDGIVIELSNGAGGIGEQTITSESINYALWDRLRELNETITDSFGMPNEGHTQFFDIMISRIDEIEEHLNFDPESIFHENGFVEYPEISLNDGLYRLSVRFKDYRLLSTLFQFEQEPTYSFHATIADSVTVGAYPNPVTENFIQVSLGSERDLEVQMRILGSDGILRHTEDVLITQELGQDFSLNLSEFNLQGNSYFFLQFLFSDQSIISKTILLPQY
jgi:hypothetical protein